MSVQTVYLSQNKWNAVNSDEQLNFKDIDQEGLTSFDLNASFVQEASSAITTQTEASAAAFDSLIPKTLEPTCNKATSMLPVCFIKDNYISIASLYFLAFKL